MDHKGVWTYTSRQRKYDHLHMLAVLGTAYTTKD